MNRYSSLSVASSGTSVAMGGGLARATGGVRQALPAKRGHRDGLGLLCHRRWEISRHAPSLRQALGADAGVDSAAERAVAAATPR